MSAPAFAAALFMALSLELIAAPAAPEISKVEPFVWVVGQTNQITISGKELSDVRGLWTSRQGVLDTDALTAKAGDEGKRLELTVPLDPMMASGPFALRMITEAGISAPVMAMLEAIPELKPDEGGLIGGAGYLTGSITDATGVLFRVRLAKDDFFAMDVSAGRFGSELDPVLQITHEDGTEVSFAQDSPGVGIDNVARFEAPKTGIYAIRIRDASYGSGREFNYHIRFGPASGGESIPHVFGTNRFNVTSPSGVGGFEERNSFLEDSFISLQYKSLGILAASSRILGWRDPVNAAYWLQPIANYAVGAVPSWPEDSRLHPNVYGVLSLNGSFVRPSDLISFDIVVKTPVKARYVAMSRRLGGQCDPLMRIEDENGNVVKTSHLFNNEAALTWDFVTPGKYRMEIWDAAGQFGSHAAFHIQAQENPTEFDLNTETDSLRIPAGGEGELNVTIDRDGYDGPMKFELAHGPEGVELTNVVAKEKSKEAKFKVKLAASLTPGTTFPLKISGRRGESDDAPKTPLYTSAYWKKRFPDLYSPMFEFEDTVWVTVLPAKVETKED